MKYKPVQQNILVEIVKEEQEGIVNPEQADIVRGLVLEIGDGSGYRPAPMVVRPQMYIWFNKVLADQLPFNKNLYVLGQSDILVLEEDE